MAVEQERIKRIVISGPSGVGKDTVVQEVEKKVNCARIVTYTSRPIRPGEREGVDYHFVSREEFRRMIDDGSMLEYVVYGRDEERGLPGDYKGTALASLEQGEGDEVALWRVDPSFAARILKGEFGDKLAASTLVVYLGVISLFDLLRRVRERGKFDREAFVARIREDWRVWKENEDVYTSKGKVVINHTGRLEETVNKVIKMAKAGEGARWSSRHPEHPLSEVTVEISDACS